MQSYLTKKVKVVRSSINRRGIFAVRAIKKGEVISVWGGTIISQKEYDVLSKKKFKNIGDYATKVWDGFYLVTSKSGRLDDDDFFNHSCSPNAGIKGHVVMVAMRNIKPGEEITYDYCMTDADYGYSFECSCKSPQCRAIISADDWKKPALQRKYKGYFSAYIEEKMRKSNCP